MRLKAKFSMQKLKIPANFRQFYNISDGGFDKGYAAGEAVGYEKGKSDGVAEGYEQGKIDGNVFRYATTLTNTFQRAAFPDCYELTIDVPNLANGQIASAFYQSTGLRKLTLNIPTNLVYSANSTFQSTNIEELVLPDGIRFNTWIFFISHNKSLKRVIGKIDASMTNGNLNTFNGCTALEEVYFMPNTIMSAITFASSADLSADAVQSIIDGLADLTGATAQTLTLHATVGAKLTDAQKATITAKNWTLVY